MYDVCTVIHSPVSRLKVLLGRTRSSCTGIRHFQLQVNARSQCWKSLCQTWRV